MLPKLVYWLWACLSDRPRSAGLVMSNGNAYAEIVAL